MESANYSKDVIIVGAGVAGSALAYTFGKDGRKVVVIERNLKEPNTIAGEILQPAGYLNLIQLGLDDCIRGIDAQKVLGYAIFKDGKSVRLPYPLENYDKNVSGFCFHHGRFVQKLREKAASLPNVKLEQGTVTTLIEENGVIKGVEYRSSSGHEMTAYASLTVICDGHFSRFRKFLSKSQVHKPSHFGGLILENCELPYPNCAHTIFGVPSAMSFYPISSTQVRCLIDFPGQKLPSVTSGEMAHYLNTVMAPQIPPELRNAFLSSVEKGDLKVMAASCMSAAPLLVPGALLLGDSLNMRHPVTGGGMTVALHDISLLRNLLRPLDFHDTPQLTTHTAHFYNTRKQMAFNINVMADAVYKVLYTTPDALRERILQSSFNYMSLRCAFPREIGGLIAGLNLNPWKIVFHLLILGLYVTVDMMILPFPTPRRVYAAAQFALVAVAIMSPVILKEGQRQVFFPTKACTRSPPEFLCRKHK